MTTRTFTALDEVEGPWRELATRSDNIFSTWEWADVWWRHFGPGRSLAVRCVHDQGTPIAILPLFSERRSGLGLMRFVGHGVADQLGPVCALSDRRPALDALRETGADLLLAERVVADLDCGVLGGRTLHAESSPVVTIPAGGDWEGYLRSRSAHFRKHLRRRMRRLTGTLGIRFRLACDPARLTDDMDALIGLHTARWAKQSRAFSGRREAFHREFAAIALERGWLRLWFAEANGGPVAAWYGFRFCGVEYFYQSGRDPAWSASEVGTALLDHSIREAFSDGMREYRLLRGDEPYKQRYATEPRRVLTIAVPRSALGHAAVAAARVLATAPVGRRLLRRPAEW